MNRNASNEIFPEKIHLLLKKNLNPDRTRACIGAAWITRILPPRMSRYNFLLSVGYNLDFASFSSNQHRQRNKKCGDLLLCCSSASQAGDHLEREQSDGGGGGRTLPRWRHPRCHLRGLRRLDNLENNISNYTLRQKAVLKTL